MLIKKGGEVMYNAPTLVVIDLTEDVPVFTACNSAENDSNSCYS